MSDTTLLGQTALERADLFSEDTRHALRDLLLLLADNKRLLGIRYSDWMLGAPSLESGIAASSMAQDEWGHSRLTYALLADFGEDPGHLEHGREAEDYCSSEALDRPFTSWAEVIAANLLLDTALTAQYAALQHSRYAPVRNRVQKLIDEEYYHLRYAAGWAQRLVETRARSLFRDALARFLPVALRWLGRPDSPPLIALLREGVLRSGPEELRSLYLQQIGPVLATVGLTADLQVTLQGQEWRCAGTLDWSAWSERRRRSEPGGPDADTLARVRGDRNRAMLLD